MPKKPRSRYREVSELEAAICQRVRQLRTELRLTQSAFGDAIQISRDNVASIEVERIPVFGTVGLAVCERFGICERWLATGTLPKRPFIPLHEHLLNRVQLIQEFGKLYRDELSVFVDGSLAEFARAIGCKVEEIDAYVSHAPPAEPIGFSVHTALKAGLTKRIGFDLDLLPAEVAKNYCDAITECAEKFLAKRRVAPPTRRRQT